MRLFHATTIGRAGSIFKTPVADGSAGHVLKTDGSGSLYFAAETDPVFVAWLFGVNPANWDTAYGWGNHASAGYLTSLAFAGLSDYPADAAGVLTNDGAGNLSWAAGGGGGGCSFGTDNQIPFTNAAGDDFDYSANLTYDGAIFTLNRTVSGSFILDLQLFKTSYLNNSNYAGVYQYPDQQTVLFSVTGVSEGNIGGEEEEYHETNIGMRFQFNRSPVITIAGDTYGQIYNYGAYCRVSDWAAINNADAIFVNRTYGVYGQVSSGGSVTAGSLTKWMYGVYAETDTSTAHGSSVRAYGLYARQTGTWHVGWGLYIASSANCYTGTGNFAIGTTSPTTKLDINGNSLRLRTARTPASAGAAGNQGEICWDSNYLYVCTATNTWKRMALSTW